jgi:hypothetical protein
MPQDWTSIIIIIIITDLVKEVCRIRPTDGSITTISILIIITRAREVSSSHP